MKHVSIEDTRNVTSMNCSRARFCATRECYSQYMIHYSVDIFYLLST